MLAMIMLFNIDVWLPKPEMPSQVRLISENDLLLQVNIGSVQIERVGTQWRYRGVEANPSHSAEFVVQQWHAAALSASSYPDNIQIQKAVTVWLARAEEPIQMTLLQANQMAYVEIGDSVYRIENVDFADLTF